MKPSAFKYVRVASVEETLSALSEYRGEAKILAGGQSLVPMMNFRLAQPAALIDINPLKELDYVRVEDGWLHVGARTRQRTLEQSTQVKENCPLLAEAVRWIGHPQTRNRGTVGGSLVHGDSTAELVLVATLLDAQIVIQKKGSSRTIRAADFFEDLMTTHIDEDEVLTQVSFPLAPPRSGWGFRELCIRHGDFAIVAAAVQLTVGEDGRFSDARVAVSGGGPKPLRIHQAEQALVGQEGNGKVFEEAAACVPDTVRPLADQKGSEAYRREMARVFVRRALDDAWSMMRVNQ
ncbi:MAG: xanthine dehydrogenase family protein subunit M [Deltaproteobacteria bacterium]|nr:xanthine dehydrogenase family protein subunit M [Deltaproteobacteria bacterium]